MRHRPQPITNVLRSPASSPPSGHRLPNMGFPLIALLLCFVAGIRLAADDADDDALSRDNPDRYRTFFERIPTETAALSPGGSRVAYSYRADDGLWLMVVDLDRQHQAYQFRIGEDSAATFPMEIRRREHTPLTIRWLGWTSEDVVVADINAVDVIVDEEGNIDYARGVILAADLKKGEAYELGRPRQLQLLPPLIPATPLDPTTTPALVSSQPDDDFGELASRPDPLAEVRSSDVRVLDFNPKKPEEIIVQVGDPTDFITYTINARTGRKRLERDDRSLPGRAVLLDRQHRIRLSIPNSTLTSFPHHYSVDRRRFTLFRWRNLDDLLGNEVEPAFHVAPERLIHSRAIPLGIDEEDPDILYFASDVGRSTFGIYALDVSSGKQTDFAVEHPDFDLVPPVLDGFGEGVLVHDRYSRKVIGVHYKGHRTTTLWFHPDLAALQEGLEHLLEGHSVRILEWDRDFRRILLRSDSPLEPARFQVYDVESNELLSLSHSPEWSGPFVRDVRAIDGLHRAQDGREVPFRILLPIEPLDFPVPLVVHLPEYAWQTIPAGFDPEAAAIAHMGYAVLQVNVPGAWGLGTAQRNAIMQGYDHAVADEVASLVRDLLSRFEIHPDRIALFGRKFGGFMALRTLQEHSDLFRCAIAIGAPLNPLGWAAQVRWETRTSGPILAAHYHVDPEARDNLLRTEPARIRRPVLLFGFQGNDRLPHDPEYSEMLSLSYSLRRRGVPAEVRPLHRDFRESLPGTTAEVFAEIAAFLNTHMFHYDTDLNDVDVELLDPQRHPRRKP